jgi:nitroreductase
MDALLHSGLDAGQIIKVNKKSLQPQIYRDIVLSRRSIRQYKDTPVPRAIIEQIIDLARHSPTASNNQNAEYIAVTERELIRQAAGSIFGFADRLYGSLQSWPGRLFMRATGLSNNRYVRRMDYARELAADGRDIILHNAPVLLLIHGPAKGVFICDNCSIAAANIINYAHVLGLGTCFVGFMTLALRFSKSLREKMNVPKNRKVYASLVMGYPEYVHTSTASRKKGDIRWI